MQELFGETVSISNGGYVIIQSTEALHAIDVNSGKTSKVSNQEEVDASMLTLDGTANKANLGANAILGVSMAVIRAAAARTKSPLWSYISKNEENSLPVPLMNILNGGAHAASNVDVQEFMVVPHGFDKFSESLRAGTEIYHSLKAVLKEEGLLGGVGDEGGFAPNLQSNEEAIKIIVKAIEKSGFKPGEDLSLIHI